MSRRSLSLSWIVYKSYSETPYRLKVNILEGVALVQDFNFANDLVEFKLNPICLLFTLTYVAYRVVQAFQ